MSAENLVQRDVLDVLEIERKVVNCRMDLGRSSGVYLVSIQV
jgi:hypothetical protein